MTELAELMNMREKRGIIITVIVFVLLSALARILPADVHVILMAKGHKFEEELTQVQTGVLSYYTEYAQYPIAPDNASLMKLLTVASPLGNPRGIAFIGFPAAAFDAKGELLDPWGTPIRLSVTGDGKLHARSAGPDKVFGTRDDLGNDVVPSGT